MQKLYLDKMAPAPCSLFIDADSLCVGRLDHVYEAFRSRAVATIGRDISDQVWGGADVASICRKYGVPGIPRFNGGVYYLEKGEVSAAVYATARSLLADYHANGFHLLRGTPNDEYLVSVAMALHGQKPVEETGTLMNSLLAGPGGIEIDVMAGHARLLNPRTHASHNPWYRLEEMHPAIVHFCGADPHEGLYAAQIRTLDLVRARKVPVAAARAWANLTLLWPNRLLTLLKSALRPAFHRIFGVRRMRPSVRS